jgi:hypothetical protein
MLLVSRSELVEEDAVSFPHLYVVGQLVVHPPSRIVSHPKHKELSRPLPGNANIGVLLHHG